MNHSIEDIQYAAGFFDGEGCVQINPKKSQPNTFVAEVRITNTNLEVLEWHRTRFGGSIGVQPPNKKVKKNKKCWYWSTASLIANAYLKTIVPFLVIKREQVQIAIDFQARVKRGCNRLTSEEIETRRAMSVRVDELKKLQHLVAYENCPSQEYIVGFVDAESNIIIYRVRRHYELALDVTNTNISILNHLKGKFGGAIICKPDKDGRNFDCFDWSFQGDPASDLMSSMKSRLICKKPQVLLGIEFQQKKNELKNAHEKLHDHSDLFIPYKEKISALNRGVEWVPSGTHS
jgi:hypothetical protein